MRAFYLAWPTEQIAQMLSAQSGREIAQTPAAPPPVVPVLVPTRDPFGALFNCQDD